MVRSLYMHRSRRRGFTLIELLVVIAIIGILASIILASLNSAREKSRDARRLSDLRQLQTALELYASDNNGQYPTTGGAWWGNCSTYGSHGTSGATGWVPNLAPQYIAVLPLDPRPSGTQYCYLYRSNVSDYMLLAYGTVETYTSTTNPAPRPGFPNPVSFAFFTSGASTW
jgi:type II secretion system protein G